MSLVYDFSGDVCRLLAGASARRPGRGTCEGTLLPGTYALPARLVLHASIRGPRVGRLEAGAEVERLDAHDGWVLVLAGPSGPVGFVEADHLAAEKPLVTLAAEKAFSDCERGPGCLSSARRQRLRCEEACDGQAGAAREKCRAACGMAFETCRSACGSRP